jgi:hypothetical protein
VGCDEIDKTGGHRRKAKNKDLGDDLILNHGITKQILDIHCIAPL